MKVGVAVGSSVAVAVAVKVGDAVEVAVGVSVKVGVEVEVGGRGVLVGGTGVLVGGSGLVRGCSPIPDEQAAINTTMKHNEIDLMMNLMDLLIQAPRCFSSITSSLAAVFRKPSLAGKQFSHDFTLSHSCPPFQPDPFFSGNRILAGDTNARFG